ncbi:hypothetical protein QFC20_005255 [Naganishia adeliensis]|uniref:Uncharacterized protein n=1 Tax=Naganishia adeliensis TaxID=92952 RepID=A0ACC2VQN7_9TREE|nr:hypothetical protein QFC20_005255 [Naganishia adeliensis]
MLSQSNTLVYYTTLVLALFHASTAIASPTPTTKRDVKNTVQAPPITQSGAAARLRQTSWREIQARNALRKSPLYRRQASAVPYLTCQATYSNLLGVARYPNVELYGGDVLPYEGSYFAETETNCLDICQGISGCIGYFFFAVDQSCFPKAELALDGWTTETDGAAFEGSVTALIGDCATANGAIISQFRSICCNSPAVVDLSQCAVSVDAVTPVARLSNVDLYGFDMDTPEEWLEIPITSESDCIDRCANSEGCVGYFYWPQESTEPRCFLKQSGWGAEAFETNNVPAMTAGSVSGILGQSCAALQGTLTDDVYQRCCNNQ